MYYIGSINTNPADFVSWEFENKELTEYDLRCEIVKEILLYNKRDYEL